MDAPGPSCSPIQLAGKNILAREQITTPPAAAWAGTTQLVTRYRTERNLQVAQAIGKIAQYGEHCIAQEAGLFNELIQPKMLVPSVKQAFGDGMNFQEGSMEADTPWSVSPIRSLWGAASGSRTARENDCPLAWRNRSLMLTVAATISGY